MTTTHPLILTAPPGLPFVEFSRELDAPVESVFAAHCDPELVRRWLGPHGYEMQVETYDVVPGGRYAYVHRSPDGVEYRFRGVFHTVRADESIIQTFEFLGAPDVVSLDRMQFVRLDGGRTRLEGRTVFPSVEARDAMVTSGMERGMRDGYERLDAVVAHVRA